MPDYVIVPVSDDETLDLGRGRIAGRIHLEVETHDAIVNGQPWANDIIGITLAEVIRGLEKI